MAVRDALGSDVVKGDYVTCLRDHVIGIGKGNIYKVYGISTGLNQLVFYDVNGVYDGVNFFKVNLQAPIPHPAPPQLDFELVATKIMRLINANPWSPSKEQIINELKFCTTIANQQSNCTKTP